MKDLVEGDIVEASREIRRMMEIWEAADHVGEQPFAALVEAALDQPNPTKALHAAVLAVLKEWGLNPSDVW